MLWPAFAFGLLSSFHCVGMCGTLALAQPSRDESIIRWLLGRLAYHAGRWGMYAILGAAVGIVGRGLGIFGWQQGLSVIAGVLMLALIVVPEATRAKAAVALGLERPFAAIRRGLGYWWQQRSLGASVMTGALNGLLPCGLVYIALAGALTAPNVTASSLYMVFFGLGTTPLLIILSIVGRVAVSAVRVRMRQMVPWAAGAMALLFIARGLGLGIPYVSPVHGFRPPGGPSPTMCHSTV
jgi:uncharacterized protein